MSKKVENENEAEVDGIKGQIVYPERHVDAERAGLYAAGKVDTLDPDDDLDEDVNPHRIQAPESVDVTDHDTVVNAEEDEDEDENA